MMNLLLTLLTLAGGIFIGSAGVFLSRKKMSNIQNVFAWFGLLILLFAVGTIGILCEEKVNTSHIFPFISEITTAAIIIYGIFLGIVISLSSEVKQAFKEKNENLTLAGAAGFTVLPLALWIVLSIGTPYSYWSCLAGAIFLGFTIASVLWIIFSFATYLFNTQKNPC